MPIQFHNGYTWETLPPTRINRYIQIDHLIKMVQNLVKEYGDLIGDTFTVTGLPMSFDIPARLSALNDLMVAVGCTDEEIKTALGPWIGWLPAMERTVFETPLEELSILNITINEPA